MHIAIWCRVTLHVDGPRLSGCGGFDASGMCRAKRCVHYGLATRPPVMYPNGSFGFDALAAEGTGLLLTEHWRRTFRDAAKDEDTGGEGGGKKGVADPEFPSASIAEFSLSLEQYAAFVHRVTCEALELNGAYLRLRRSEVVQRLRDVGAMNPHRVFEAFVLAPRARWDEQYPANAKARDWYPWRYNRRLSIMRRPLVQLSIEANPFVIVVPSILAGTSRYLHQAAFGDLPVTLFDSPEMAACIGRAADRNGHEFARRVEERLGELRWKTKREVRLTRFGGEESLGDIDVLGLATGYRAGLRCRVQEPPVRPHLRRDRRALGGIFCWNRRWEAHAIAETP